jgi:hypothetical protein
MKAISAQIRLIEALKRHGISQTLIEQAEREAATA